MRGNPLWIHQYTEQKRQQVKERLEHRPDILEIVLSVL